MQDFSHAYFVNRASYNASTMEDLAMSFYKRSVGTTLFFQLQIEEERIAKSERP